jgi:hypothetical protein
MQELRNPQGSLKVVKRPRGWRLISYIRAMGWILAGIILVGGILALVQIFYHPFDLIIDEAQWGLAQADKTLKAETITGVSIGSLALVLVVAAIPFFKRGVRKRQFAISFWRGLLSSAIFLGTDKLYRYMQTQGILYFSATLALFVAATIILVEVVSRAGKYETESDTRTELLASIVSGLVFGLIVQAGEYLLKLTF